MVCSSTRPSHNEALCVPKRRHLIRHRARPWEMPNPGEVNVSLTTDERGTRERSSCNLPFQSRNVSGMMQHRFCNRHTRRSIYHVCVAAWLSCEHWEASSRCCLQIQPRRMEDHGKAGCRKLVSRADRNNCAQAVLKAYASLTGVDQRCVERFSRSGQWTGARGGMRRAVCREIHARRRFRPSDATRRIHPSRGIAHMPGDPPTGSTFLQAVCRDCSRRSFRSAARGPSSSKTGQL